MMGGPGIKHREDVPAEEMLRYEFAEWLETNIGGTVRSLEQQPRWRPTWFAEALVPFFHRRNLRAQMLNGPDGSAMARHNPMQRFPRRLAGRA